MSITSSPPPPSSSSRSRGVAGPFRRGPFVCGPRVGTRRARRVRRVRRRGLRRLARLGRRAVRCVADDHLRHADPSARAAVRRRCMRPTTGAVRLLRGLRRGAVGAGRVRHGRARWACVVLRRERRPVVSGRTELGRQLAAPVRVPDLAVGRRGARAATGRCARNGPGCCRRRGGRTAPSCCCGRRRRSAESR